MDRPVWGSFKGVGEFATRWVLVHAWGLSFNWCNMGSYIIVQVPS